MSIDAESPVITEQNTQAIKAGAEIVRLRAALEAILAEPYGCQFCDSGKLRNPAKPHTETCGFALAQAALSE